MTAPVEYTSRRISGTGGVNIKFRLNHSQEIAEILAVGLGDEFERLLKAVFRKIVWFGCGRHLKFCQGGEWTFCGSAINVYF